MNNPSDETKTKIISSFGEDFFNQILEKRKISVWESSSFSQTDFLFLLQYSRKEAANKYVFDKKDMIDNEYFERDFIKTVKKNCSPLIQSLVIRVPLNFYLNKARSKYYNTAVNHLKYLDEIAPTVTDWKDVLSHDEYKAKLRTRHAKKYSFWEQYD